MAPLSHGAASARGDCPDLRTSERTRGPTWGLWGVGGGGKGKWESGSEEGAGTWAWGNRGFPVVWRGRRRGRGVLQHPPPTPPLRPGTAGSKPQFTKPRRWRSRSAWRGGEDDGLEPPHPHPRPSHAFQSLSGLTLRASSPAAGGARSAALGDPRPPPLLLSLCPWIPPQRPPPPPYSSARRKQVRAPRQLLRAGPGREGGGRRGGRGSGGQARALRAAPQERPPQADAGCRKADGHWEDAPSPAGRRAPFAPRGEAGREARHRYARGEGTAGGRLEAEGRGRGVGAKDS